MSGQLVLSGHEPVTAFMIPSCTTPPSELPTIFATPRILLPYVGRSPDIIALLLTRTKTLIVWSATEDI